MFPTYFWRASASPPDSLPLSFDCLLDNGSHLNLICDSLVNQLGLRRKELRTPIEMTLAMHLNKDKTTITFYNFVKLPLYDVAGRYHAKSICAIVMLNLCCLVLLGLPFLSHNNIVIDHAEQMAVDTSQNYDLLNPSV